MNVIIYHPADFFNWQSLEKYFNWLFFADVFNWCFLIKKVFLYFKRRNYTYTYSSLRCLSQGIKNIVKYFIKQFGFHVFISLLYFANITYFLKTSIFFQKKMSKTNGV